jgi:hypothetical protein
MFLMGKRFLRCDIETNAGHDVCLSRGEGGYRGTRVVSSGKYESECWGKDTRGR